MCTRDLIIVTKHAPSLAPGGLRKSLIPLVAQLTYSSFPLSRLLPRGSLQYGTSFPFVKHAPPAMVRTYSVRIQPTYHTVR